MGNRIFQSLVRIYDLFGDEETILRRIYFSDNLEKVQRAVDVDVRNNSHGNGLDCIDTEITESSFVEVEPGLSKLIGGKIVARGSLHGVRYFWQILDESQLNDESGRQR